MTFRMMGRCRAWTFRLTFSWAANDLATLHTNARTDDELLQVWIKSHADGSVHTRRLYERIGARFLVADGWWVVAAHVSIVEAQEA